MQKNVGYRQKLSNILFVALSLSLALGQFVSSSWLTPGGVYLYDVLVVGYVCLGVYTLGSLSKLHIPKNLFLFLIFSFWLVISFGYNLINQSGFATLEGFLYLLRFGMYILGGVVTYNLVLSHIFKKQFVIRTIVYCGLLFSGIGFSILALYPDFGVFDLSLGWDPHKFRFAGSVFDPNFAGCYLALCILYLAIAGFSKKVTWVMFGSFALGLILTFSRSSWAFASLIVLSYGLLKTKKMLILAVLGFALVYFAVPRVQTRLTGLTDPADSAYFRLRSWQNTVKVFVDHPGFGVGYNNFRQAQKENAVFEAGTYGGRSGSGSDSSFLLIFACSGVIGGLLFGAAYFFPVFEQKTFLVWGLIFGLFVQTQFINALFYPQILFLWSQLYAIDFRSDT